MTDRPGVTLQISLAPGDLRYARDTLPHLMRQWGGQVQEVLFTVDAPPERRALPEIAAKLEELKELARQVSAGHPGARISEVDYSPACLARVSQMFFRGRRFPTHDYRHRPVYPYFFALNDARFDFVFHVDSDMLFGGGSQTWVAEAVELLQSRPDIFTVSPLPGPPTRDGSLRTQRAPREPLPTLAYRFDHLSSRLFFLDRRVFNERMGGLRARYANPRRMLNGLLHGQAPWETCEDMVTRPMRKQKLSRVDFLGTAPGMWSLHPFDQTESFLRYLPQLVRRVETGDVPEAQRGAYDLTSALLEAEWIGGRNAAVPT